MSIIIRSEARNSIVIWDHIFLFLTSSSSRPKIKKVITCHFKWRSWERKEKKEEGGEREGNPDLVVQDLNKSCVINSNSLDFPLLRPIISRGLSSQKSCCNSYTTNNMWCFTCKIKAPVFPSSSPIIKFFPWLCSTFLGNHRLLSHRDCLPDECSIF